MERMKTSIGNEIDSSHFTAQKAVAIVVTYNKKQLLINCIQALADQTYPCDIIIVDNASTDGTRDLLSDNGPINQPHVHYLRLEENTGGSGGFFQGLSFAMAHSWNWFWLMDDDAVPEPNALEKLLAITPDPLTVYGSITCGEINGSLKLSWPALPLGKKVDALIDDPENLAPLEEVFMIPFLGFFIHRRLITRIGYPDPEFFISTDDVEYSVRARKRGARLLLVKSSRITHLVASVKTYFIGNFRIVYRELPPWKLYYETRNKILLARRHYGWKLWIQTIPGVLLRVGLSVFIGKNDRVENLWMFTRALIDGLLNRTGKRVLPPKT